MTRKMWRDAVMVVLVLWLLLGPVRAGLAGVSPEDQLAIETAAWVSEVTGVPLASKEIRAVDRFSSPSVTFDDAWAVVPWAPGDVAANYTEVQRPMAMMIRSFAVHRGRKPWSQMSLYAFLHETLHRYVPADTGDRAIEEALTDTTTADLWPAWVRKFTGRRRAPVLSLAYPFEVDAARRTSLVATRSGIHTAAARRWRWALWGADPATRRQRLQELPANPNNLLSAYLVG